MGHISQSDLDNRTKKASKQVRVGTKYYHFKNPDQHYEIEFVGILENTEEVCVGYRALYGKEILWVRSLDDFLSAKMVDGKKVKRFSKV